MHHAPKSLLVDLVVPGWSSAGETLDRETSSLCRIIRHWCESIFPFPGKTPIEANHGELSKANRGVEENEIDGA